jgi:hypothetical protein
MALCIRWCRHFSKPASNLSYLKGSNEDEFTRMKARCLNPAARALLGLWAAVLMIVGSDLPIQAAENPVRQEPAFNIETATRAYLDRIPPDKKARSDAYFEGGYWLQLWQFLYGSASPGCYSRLVFQPVCATWPVV